MLNRLTPGSLQDVTAQITDTDGNVLFSEPENVLVGEDGTVGVLLGNNTPDGAPPLPSHPAPPDS